MAFEGNVDPGEIQQNEEPATAIVVPVEITTPVRTQELPSKLSGLGTKTLTTTPQVILRKDPRRKRATIISFDQDFRLGVTKAQADPTSGTGADWPQDVPLPIDTSEEIWAASLTSTSKLTIIQEAWAL